jgi:purine/pyrimidine-nucleoside phosphorylase
VKHNSYFEGKVQSLAMTEAEGSATLGVIEPGSYKFSTTSQERMTVVAGSMRVRVPGAEVGTFAAGETFVVASGISFEVEADADVAYICRYR